MAASLYGDYPLHSASPYVIFSICNVIIRLTESEAPPILRLKFESCGASVALESDGDG